MKLGLAAGGCDACLQGFRKFTKNEIARPTTGAAQQGVTRLFGSACLTKTLICGRQPEENVEGTRFWVELRPAWILEELQARDVKPSFLKRKDAVPLEKEPEPR